MLNMEFHRGVDPALKSPVGLSEMMYRIPAKGGIPSLSISRGKIKFNSSLLDRPTCVKNSV